MDYDEHSCIPCCDNCKYYKDNGTGIEKRNYFSGVGVCKLFDAETLASNFCDDFICSICNAEMIGTVSEFLKRG